MMGYDLLQLTEGLLQRSSNNWSELFVVFQMLLNSQYSSPFTIGAVGSSLLAMARKPWLPILALCTIFKGIGQRKKNRSVRMIHKKTYVTLTSACS